MVKFKPIVRKPGEVIRSDEWNKIQEDVLSDLQELEGKLQTLKDYVDNMEQTQTLLNMLSPVGTSYSLNEIVPGEKMSYESPVVGLLTKQWISPKDPGVICKYGISSKFESIDFWAGAENGDKKTLELTFEYMDGTNAIVKDLFIHERTKLRPKGNDNPYREYLLAPNENVWYRYKVVNPSPKKSVLTLTFKNAIPECHTRIGNVIHLSLKITQDTTVKL
jgi:hypothetical protein